MARATEVANAPVRVRCWMLGPTLVAVLVALCAPGLAHAATFLVTTTADSGAGSLREAIIASNTNPGADLIAFNIAGPPPHSIQPITPLPSTTGPVTIDGTTEPDYAGSPIVELDGSLAGATGSGITLDGGNSTVRGLVINRFAPTANQQGGGVYVRIGGNNVIEGNYIGTDVTGMLSLGNSSGVFLGGTGGNRVGGTTPAARNIIADNRGPNGAGIWTVSHNNVIQGNYIGTDVTGTIALGNGGGLVITGRDNLIGGTSPGARNVISGNQALGLQICANCGAFPTTGNIVQGNYIGTDASGTTAVPNLGTFGGAAVLVRASGNTIGGTVPGAGNVVSGNNGAGVVVGFLFGSGAMVTDNLLAGNLIGTAADGFSPLGNTGHGIRVGPSTPSFRNTIGGTASGAANTIAHNGQDGVFVEANSNENPILGNSIYGNGSLGIDLGPDGVTANDAGDADTGANNLQNFPVLTMAVSNGVQTSIWGSLNSQPNTTYRLEFFSNPACDGTNGEGQTFLGSAQATTDESGNATFVAHQLGGIPSGRVATSTATDPGNNSSEFSACRTVRMLARRPASARLRGAESTADPRRGDQRLYRLPGEGDRRDMSATTAAGSSCSKRPTGWRLPAKLRASPFVYGRNVAYVKPWVNGWWEFGKSSASFADLVVERL